MGEDRCLRLWAGLTGTLPCPQKPSFDLLETLGTPVSEVGSHAPLIRSMLLMSTLWLMSLGSPEMLGNLATVRSDVRVSLESLARVS